MPAAGSSSSRIRGRVASASAISTSRCRPYGRLRVSVSASASSRSERSSARASSISSSSSRRCDARRAARPLRSQIASTTDSSTVRPGNSVLIWNVRVTPRLTRSCCGKSGDALAAEEHVAGARREHAGEQIDERGLARAVGADERVARAGRQRQRDVGVRLEPAELLRQSFGVQRGASWCAQSAALRAVAQRSRARPGCRRARRARRRPAAARARTASRSGSGRTGSDGRS